MANELRISSVNALGLKKETKEKSHVQTVERFDNRCSMPTRDIGYEGDNRRGRQRMERTDNEQRRNCFYEVLIY